MSIKDILEIDYYVAGHSKGMGSWIHDLVYPNYSLKYIATLRKFSYFQKKGTLFPKLYSIYLKYKLNKLSAKTGFYIPEDVFGPGLYIPHFGSVIVNPNAKIGAYCQINANVVIGQERGKTPIIGDNCFIGAGAVICGDIKIGNNVWIGANSVLTKSFEEDNVLIAGIPAKVICTKESNWLQEFGLIENEK